MLDDEGLFNSTGAWTWAFLITEVPFTDSTDSTDSRHRKDTANMMTTRLIGTMTTHSSVSINLGSLCFQSSYQCEKENQAKKRRRWKWQDSAGTRNDRYLQCHIILFSLLDFQSAFSLEDSVFFLKKKEWV